mgnify:CR=1 FL=1
MAGYTANTVLPGYTSTDYTGSADEWEQVVARSLLDRYLRGDQSMLDNLSFGGTGQPDRADFGSTIGGGTGTVSAQTQAWALDYARNYAAKDPWIMSQFGAPPSRRATYDEPYGQKQHDVWSSGEAAKDRTFQAGENAADRAARIQEAQISANAQVESAGIYAGASRYAADQQLAGVRLNVENDWKIAVMQDATNRYIAEGNWGTQKYIAELQERGQLERLQMQLAQDDKHLAQSAEQERNRHHEAMMGLALEVAKYDAELAAQPRNWLKYAAWLKSRDIVVNGLSLAMAAQEVPDDAISPQTVQDTTGSGIAAYQTAQDVQSGQSGGSTGPEGANPFAGPAMASTASAPSAGTLLDQQTLDQMDPGAFARQLLANSAQASDASPQNLQAAYNAVDTTGGGQGQPIQGFGGNTGGGSGYVTNGLGMQVQTLGQKNDYRKFTKLLPSAQEQNVAAAESGGMYAQDYVGAMERSRPKGNLSTGKQVASYA